MAGFAFHTILPLVPPDDLRTNIETDTQSLEPVGAFFHPVEFAENVRLIVLAYADLKVPDPDHQPAFGVDLRFNLDLLVLRRIFHRVGEIVDDHLLDPCLVAIQLYIRPAPPDDLVVGVSLPDHFHGAGQGLPEIEQPLVELQPAALDLRQVQQIHDQVVQLSDLHERPVHIQLYRIVIADAPFEQLHIRFDRRQRRLELMTGDTDEFVLFPDSLLLILNIGKGTDPFRDGVA